MSTVDPGPLIPVAEWRASVLARIAPLPAEVVTVADAHGRALAAPARAAWPLPPFTSSAMDGFAVRADDAVEGARLTVVAESRAGHPSGVTLAQGEAIRISTGAVVPDGADAVVPVEHASDRGGHVRVATAADAGAYVRRRGEDLDEGTTLLEAGVRLGPSELGLLAAGGLSEVEVGARPRVTVMSTGDEVVSASTPTGPGQVRDVNGLTLVAMSREAGARVRFSGPVPDEEDALRRAIADGCVDTDLLLTSGGVSVGEHDLVGAVLSAAGEVEMGRVAMKPGMPQAFGLLRGPSAPIPVFGLPGNPVSAAVSFEMFVRPAIRKCAGMHELARPTVEAEIATSMPALPTKVTFARVGLEHTAHGWVARAAGRDGSHLFRSFAAADGLAEIPVGTGPLAAGATVTVHCLFDAPG